MKLTRLRPLLAVAVFVLAQQADASTVIAFERFGGDNLNLISLTGEESFAAATSVFEELDPVEDAPPPAFPDVLIDGTLGSEPGDTLGIVADAFSDELGLFVFDPFFGVTNVDPTPADGSTSTAVFTFDVSGGADLVLSFDAAAIGDFEPDDGLTFEIGVALDGVSLETFEVAVDVGAAQTVTFADGSTSDFINPLDIGGVTLSNVFQTFTTGNLGSGDELTFTLTSSLSGVLDGFALDNIVVESVIPEPHAIALAALAAAGLSAARRRH